MFVSQIRFTKKILLSMTISESKVNSDIEEDIDKTILSAKAHKVIMNI